MTVPNSTIQFAPHPKRKNFHNMAGEVYGRLTVLGLAGRSHNNNIWYCRCECGNIVTPTGTRLRSGHTGSCGCLQQERAATAKTKHGEGYSVEYKAFHAAKARCQNSNLPSWDDYGGRGIEFRFESFEQFLAEVGRRPDGGYSLDRKDVNGHYEVGNVRWATDMEQARNTRTNRMLTVDGVTLCASEWADRVGLARTIVHSRIRFGFCDRCAVGPKGTHCMHKTIS